MKVSGKAQFEGVDREFEIRLLGKGRRSAFATIIIGVISLVEHDFNEKKQFDQLKLKDETDSFRLKARSISFEGYIKKRERGKKKFGL